MAYQYNNLDELLNELGVGSTAGQTTYAGISGAGWASAGISAVGGFFTSYFSAKAEKATLNMQAKLADIQARSATNAAEDALRAGNRQAAAVSYEYGQKKSTAKTTMAASGVRVGKGSSAEVLTNYDISKSTQRYQILANAVAQSWGYKWQAVGAKAQANSYRAAASSVSPFASATSAAVSKGITGLVSHTALTGERLSLGTGNTSNEYKATSGLGAWNPQAQGETYEEAYTWFGS